MPEDCIGGIGEGITAPRVANVFLASNTPVLSNKLSVGVVAHPISYEVMIATNLHDDTVLYNDAEEIASDLVLSEGCLANRRPYDPGTVNTEEISLGKR